MNWTTEQILGLAPDQFTLRAARSTAEPERWTALHHDGRLLWAIFPNGSAKTAETAVHLPSHTYTCTCNSRKTPCRHTVALLLLWQENRPAFTAQPAPRTLAARANRHTIASQRPLRHSYSQETQLAHLQTGLNELALWLTDLVRHGLARLPDRPKSYWHTMADRLVDAQAPTLALELRRLATVPTAQPNWPEAYLQRLGQLHLIIQGFRHFDQLPATTQADLQTAVGWLPPPHDDTPPITDRWLVLGRQQEFLGSQTRHFTWLWGQDSQQPAQLIELAAATRIPMGAACPPAPSGTVRCTFCPAAGRCWPPVRGILWRRQRPSFPTASPPFTMPPRRTARPWPTIPGCPPSPCCCTTSCPTTATTPGSCWIATAPPCRCPTNLATAGTWPPWPVVRLRSRCLACGKTRSCTPSAFATQASGTMYTPGEAFDEHNPDLA
jgi:hypothetical protein